MHLSSKQLRQLWKDKTCLATQNNIISDSSFKLNLSVFNDLAALVAILKYVKSIELDLTLDRVCAFILCNLIGTLKYFSNHMCFF